ncbi:MAG: glycosyltransferase family 87 protein [Terriglobales bacterium]
MKNFPISKAVWWLLLSIVSAGSMAYYATEIWSANQPPHFNDFYARWFGAHELLLHGRNPYSPSVSHEIQAVIYGASVNAGSPDDPTGLGGGFAYPPYVALLLWPTIYLSFPVAQKVFLCGSILAALVSLMFWLHLLRFRWSLLAWLTVAVFTFGSFPSLQAIKLQNPSLLAASCIAIALFLLTTDHFILAGGLLAVSTFKPQFAIAIVPWLALWTIGDWRRRRPLAWSFLTTMLLLVLISEWLVPGWISSFLNVTRAYRHYTYGHSLLDVWFTPMWGAVVGVCLVFAAFAFCWRHRTQPADSMKFLVATNLLLAVTLVIIPTLAPHAQLLLLPGFLCLLRGRTLLLSAGVLPRLVLAATWAQLAWPWIASFGLLLAAIRFPVSALLRFWAIPLYTSPILPAAVSLALGSFLRTIDKAGDRESPLLVSEP